MRGKQECNHKQASTAQGELTKISPVRKQFIGDCAIESVVVYPENFCKRRECFVLAGPSDAVSISRDLPRLVRVRNSVGIVPLNMLWSRNSSPVARASSMRKQCGQHI